MYIQTISKIGPAISLPEGGILIGGLQHHGEAVFPSPIPARWPEGETGVDRFIPLNGRSGFVRAGDYTGNWYLIHWEGIRRIRGVFAEALNEIAQEGWCLGSGSTLIGKDFTISIGGSLLFSGRPGAMETEINRVRQDGMDLALEPAGGDKHPPDIPKLVVHYEGKALRCLGVNKANTTAAVLDEETGVLAVSSYRTLAVLETGVMEAKMGPSGSIITVIGGEEAGTPSVLLGRMDHDGWRRLAVFRIRKHDRDFEHRLIEAIRGAIDVGTGWLLWDSGGFLAGRHVAVWFFGNDGRFAVLPPGTNPYEDVEGPSFRFRHWPGHHLEPIMLIPLDDRAPFRGLKTTKISIRSISERGIAGYNATSLCLNISVADLEILKEGWEELSDFKPESVSSLREADVEIVRW